MLHRSEAQLPHVAKQRGNIAALGKNRLLVGQWERMNPKSRLTSVLKLRDELLKITVATAITKVIYAHDVQQFLCSLIISAKRAG